MSINHVTAKETVLYEGTYGEVFEAVNGKGEPLVIKKFKSGREFNYKESFIVSSLSRKQKSNSYVSRFVKVWSPGGLPKGLVFHREKMNLAKFLNENRDLSIEKVKDFSMQLLKALAFLKKNGVVHADIKPENILVSEDTSIIRVADFGLAFFAKESQRLRSVQTLYYRSPEVILGDMSYGYPIDIWSVAIIVIELFMGQVLFMWPEETQIFAAQLRFFGRAFPLDSMGSFSKAAVDRFFAQYLKSTLIPSWEDAVASKRPEGSQSFIDFVGKFFKFEHQERVTPDEALLDVFLVGSPPEEPAAKKQRVDSTVFL